MKHCFILCFFLGFLLLITGCTNLAKMTPVERITSLEDDSSLVNFVRPSILVGDAIKYEIWDGKSFIGTLGAGTMIQYKTTPGDHVFMLDSKNRGWAFVKANLKEGKTYYMKPNMPPFAGMILGVAKSTDDRVEIWHETLTPMAVDKVKSKEIPIESIKQAESRLNDFKLGKVRFHEVSSDNEF